MRFLETVDPNFGPVRRPYVRIVIGGNVLVAIVDTGADASSIDERTARRIGIRYRPSGLSSGIGGDVPAFRAEPAVVTILAPRRRGDGVEWVAVGSHSVELSVLRAPARLPALLGRADLLVHYRFAIRERDGTFDLTPLKTAQ